MNIRLRAIEGVRSPWISRDLWILDVIVGGGIVWGSLVEVRKQKQMREPVRGHVAVQQLAVNNPIMKKVI
jgi:hypothetical protein